MKCGWGTQSLGLIAATVLLAACTQTQVEVDRNTLYGSVDAMTQDSQLIAVGLVTERRVVVDIDGSNDKLSVSTFETKQVLDASGVAPFLPGDVVEVRQFGVADAGMYPPMMELLEANGVYLLFVTESGLEGPLSDQFYITGSSAGIYVPAETQMDANSSSGGRTFEQLEKQEVEHDLREAVVRESRVHSS